MSNVHLNHYLRNSINIHVREMVGRLPIVEEMRLWGNEAPPYADAKPLVPMILDHLPTWTREVMLDIDRAKRDDPEKYTYYRDIMRLSDSVAFDVSERGGHYNGVNKLSVISSFVIENTGLEIPDTLSWRTANPKVPVDSELMQAVYLMRHYHESICSEGLFISASIDSYLSTIRTAGQLRRDWPELLTVLPVSLTTKLGNTISKKPSGSHALPSASARDKIMEGLARAACLDIGTEVSKPVIIVRMGDFV